MKRADIAQGRFVSRAVEFAMGSFAAFGATLAEAAEIGFDITCEHIERGDIGLGRATYRAAVRNKAALVEIVARRVAESLLTTEAAS